MEVKPRGFWMIDKSSASEPHPYPGHIILNNLVQIS